MLVSVSYVVELMSYVTLNSSFSPASLACLIGKMGDATIAEQRSMMQVGDMSTSQLKSPCVKYNQSHQVKLCRLVIQMIVSVVCSCVLGLLVTVTTTTSALANSE